jgi:hypothetical protein
MADLSDFTTSSGMTITFDPNAPPLPPPVVAANPSSGLVDRQQVAVNASGFIPGENVLVQECAASDLAKCAAGLFGVGGGTADPTGAIAVGITVRRAIYVDGTRLDCASAVGACVVTAQAAGGPLGRTNLGFDGSKPLPPPPAITVTPSTGLADRQIVRVSGSGFTPSNPVVMTQCKAGATLVSGDCSISVYRQAVTSADGTFSATLEVRTHVDTFGPNGQPSTLDCSVSASTCVVNALDESDFPTNASAPISFDPNASPLPPPSATVIPSTGLVDGQTVRVAADGFPPGASLFVVQCKAGAVDPAIRERRRRRTPPGRLPPEARAHAVEPAAAGREAGRAREPGARPGHRGALLAAAAVVERSGHRLRVRTRCVHAVGRFPRPDDRSRSRAARIRRDGAAAERRRGRERHGLEWVEWR